MGKAAYPTAAELARHLHAAGLFAQARVSSGGAGTGVTVASNKGFRVGDTGYFVTAAATRTVTAKTSTTGITADSTVTTTTNEQIAIIPGALDLATALAAGIAAFEDETGRKFLASGDTTRTFDPPTHRGMLDLAADLCAVTSLSVDSVAKTVATDYRLLPLDAAGDGKPWNRVEFNAQWYYPLSWASNGAISIVGRWAYATTIPEDVWRAMLCRAALTLVPQLALMLTGGVVDWREADIAERYGDQPLKGLSQYRELEAGRTAARYRRKTVGL